MSPLYSNKPDLAHAFGLTSLVAIAPCGERQSLLVVANALRLQGDRVLYGKCWQSWRSPLVRSARYDVKDDMQVILHK